MAKDTTSSDKNIKVLNIYEDVDNVNSYTDNDGNRHYNGRAYQHTKDGKYLGKVYPDSREGGYSSGEFTFKCYSPCDADIRIHAGNPDVEGKMACIEYIEEDSPGVLKLKCTRRDSVDELYREFYIKESLLSSLTAAQITNVENKVSAMVSSIPESVHHKGDDERIIKLLKTGIQSRKPLSVSDKQLKQCELYLQDRNISLHIPIPSGVCPIPLDYRPFTRKAGTDSLTMQRLYEIRMAEELRRKYPSCSCTTVHDINDAESGIGMESEREILLKPCANQTPISPNDVIGIHVDTHCGANLDKFNKMLAENGLGQYSGKVKETFIG